MGRLWMFALGLISSVAQPCALEAVREGGRLPKASVRLHTSLFGEGSWTLLSENSRLYVVEDGAIPSPWRLTARRRRLAVPASLATPLAITSLASSDSQPWGIAAGRDSDGKPLVYSPYRQWRVPLTFPNEATVRAMALQTETFQRAECWVASEDTLYQAMVLATGEGLSAQEPKVVARLPFAADFLVRLKSNAWVIADETGKVSVDGREYALGARWIRSFAAYDLGDKRVFWWVDEAFKIQRRAFASDGSSTGESFALPAGVRAVALAAGAHTPRATGSLWEESVGYGFLSRFLPSGEHERVLVWGDNGQLYSPYRRDQGGTAEWVTPRREATPDDTPYDGSSLAETAADSLGSN